MAIITVIDKAKELIQEVGKDKAIEYFEERIKNLTPPKNFGESCKIAGAEIAIGYIKKHSADMQK